VGPAREVAITALVFLFAVEAQRAFFGSLFGLAYDAVFPTSDPARALLAVLPLVALAAPLIPVTRWLDRRGAVVVGAVGVALFRLPMTDPSLAARLVGSALVLACAGVFLNAAVGHGDRRALGAGAVLGLVLDQLVRVAGVSYDLSLRSSWFPVQAVLSLGLVALVFLWVRVPDRRREHPPELERRSGGLRLRGGLALGALLFLDLHVLAAPPVLSRWTGMAYPVAALAVSAAGAAALTVTLRSRRPGWGRLPALGLAAGVTAGLLSGYWTDGPGALTAMAGGHAAALILVARSLDPASGRRGGGNVTAALLLLTVLATAYSLTFFPAFTLSALAGAAPWIFFFAGLLVAGAFVLLPRPADVRPPAGPVTAAAIGVAVAGLGAILAWAPARPVGEPAPAGASIRVGTYNVHYGYDEAWRFHPERIAAAIARADVDVMALQETPVGLPTAYGVDLPLWLGRRLGARAIFSGTADPLLGEAVLARVPVDSLDAVPLPDPVDGAQLVRLTTAVGDEPITIAATHLSVLGDRTAQAAMMIDAVGPGAAVILGDLNTQDPGPVVDLLRGAGFHDVFRDAGRPEPTFPAGEPAIRIDWIWVRGLTATGARVLQATASDHRPVVATLQSRDPRLR
jgi:endonuclease/exonuclease/phosphatase family metal-dependent hydrolase